MMCEFDGTIAFNWVTSAARLSNVGGGAAARPCCAATVGTIAPTYPTRSAATPKRTPEARSNRLRTGIRIVIPSPPVEEGRNARERWLSVAILLVVINHGANRARHCRAPPDIRSGPPQLRRECLSVAHASARCCFVPLSELLSTRTDETRPNGASLLRLLIGRCVEARS